MKTLPDAITAGKDGDSERVILTRIIPEDTDAWGELCWATKPVYVDAWGPCNAGEANFVSNRGTLIEDFEDIDNWGLGGTGTKEVDTIYRRQGSQSIKLNAVNGGETIITKALTHDMSSMTNVVFWCYVPIWEPPAVSPFHRMRILFSNDAGLTNFFALDLLLNYGSYNWYIYDFKPGWNKIVIPKDVFDEGGSPDWANPIVRIQVKINARAGENCSVRFDDLRMNYSARAKCMIHFDDHRKSAYTLGKPILDGNGQKATVFSDVDKIGYSGAHMDMDDLKTLYNNGWDISNHSRSHATLPDCSPSELEDEVNGAHDILMTNGFVRSAKYFAYPNGAFDSTVIAKVKERHVLARSVIQNASTRAGYAHIQLRDNNADMVMRIDGVSQNDTPATVKGWIDNAIQANSLITFMFHVLVEGEPTPGQPEYNIDDFEEISDYLKTKEADIDVVTMDEYYNDLVHGGILKEKGFGSIKQSVDIEEGGNVAKVGNMQISVLNPQYAGQDRFDECFEGMNMENRTVEIWSGFYTGSDLQKADLLLRFRGVVDDVSFDYGEYTIKIKDAGFKRHKNIPGLLITEDDYPNAPERNWGKPMPLFYGELETTGSDPAYGEKDAPPIMLLDEQKYKWLYSLNKPTSVNDQRLWLYFGNSVWLYFLPTATYSVTYGRPTTIEFASGGLAQNLLGVLVMQLRGQGKNTSPSSLDFSNAVDNSDTSYLTLGANEKLYLKVPVPADPARVQDETMLFMRVVFGSITGTGKLRYYNPEWDAGVGKISDGIAFDSGDANGNFDLILADDKTAHGREDDQGDQQNLWQLDEVTTLEFGIEMDADSSAQIKNVEFHGWNLLMKGNVEMLVIGKPGLRRWFMKPSHLQEVNLLVNRESYAAGQFGARFGAWVDQNSRNNGYDEDQLIEGGIAYTIEAMLRDELGLTSDEIDYDSFDDTGNTTDGDRKLWKLSGIVDKQELSLNIIKEICRQTGIIYFENYENKEKIVALKKRTASKTIDRTTIQEGAINIRFSNLSQVYNEFYMNYKPQWFDGNYMKTLFVTASDHNLSSNVRSGTPNTFTGLCGDSQDKYLKTNRLTLDCDWIRDDATAELLIKWLAEWLCYRKYIVGFETAGLDHVDLELGDQVKIDHTLLPDGVSNDDSFLLYDISDDLNNDKMKFKFIQIPDLLP